MPARGVAGPVKSTFFGFIDLTDFTGFDTEIPHNSRDIQLTNAVLNEMDIPTTSLGIWPTHPIGSLSTHSIYTFPQTRTSNSVGISESGNTTLIVDLQPAPRKKNLGPFGLATAPILVVLIFLRTSVLEFLLFFQSSLPS